MLPSRYWQAFTLTPNPIVKLVDVARVEHNSFADDWERRSEDTIGNDGKDDQQGDLHRSRCGKAVSFTLAKR